MWKTYVLMCLVSRVREIIRAQWNIYDGAFVWKYLTTKKTLPIFWKKLHHRISTGFYIRRSTFFFKSLWDSVYIYLLFSWSLVLSSPSDFIGFKKVNFTDYNLGQKIVEKFTNLGKIEFSMECTADFSWLSSINVKICLLCGRLGARYQIQEFQTFPWNFLVF